MNTDSNSLMSKDRYVVKGLLGEGSYGIVYKLLHTKTGKSYAGKQTNQFFKGKQDIINCTEINIMKRIEDHPNILGLKDIICDSFPCKIVLVFELMDMNLFEFLKEKQKPMAESVARSFFYQIICGIEHLHKNGLFHRDVKPENVLIKSSTPSQGIAQDNRSVVVKLADFGLAKSIQTDATLTNYIATRWYRSPECILTKGHYGPKLDVWSVGCIFYEMLTLKPMFPGENEIDQLDKIHKVLGTPSSRVLRRFQHLKLNFEFPKVEAIQLGVLLPDLSRLGLGVLQACLSYLPDTRISSTHLKEHYYFSDMIVKNSNRKPDSARKSSRTVPNQKNNSSSNEITAKSPVSVIPSITAKSTPSLIPLRSNQKRQDHFNSVAKVIANKQPKRQRKLE